MKTVNACGLKISRSNYALSCLSAMFFIRKLAGLAAIVFCLPWAASANEFGNGEGSKKYLACRQLAEVVLNKYSPPLNEAVSAISKSIKNLTHRSGKIKIAAAEEPEADQGKIHAPPNGDSGALAKPVSLLRQKGLGGEEVFLHFSLDSVATPDYGQVVLTFHRDFSSSRISIQSDIRLAFDADAASYSQVSIWWKFDF